MAYLYINRSDSHCECSGASVDPYLLKCPYCGEKWTHVSSDYAGSKHFEMTVRNMRPDLTAHFPWTEFYERPEGQELIDDLLGILDKDD